MLNRLSNAYDFGKKLGIKRNPVDDVERRRDRIAPEQVEALALGQIADHGEDQPTHEAGVLRAIGPDEVFSAAELKRLIDNAKPGVQRAFLMTAILCGCRVGELCGLRWSEVNFKGAYITINRSLTELSKKHGGIILEPPKTKRGYRKIPVPKELIAELREWKLQCPPTPNRLAFVTERGKPVRRDWAKKTLRGTIKRINAKHPDNKLKLLSMNNLRQLCIAALECRHAVAESIGDDGPQPTDHHPSNI